MRSTGLSWWAAWVKTLEYSIYSQIRCRKLNGSFSSTGMVILLRSFPIQFLRTDQTLIFFLDNIGAGSSRLKKKNTKLGFHYWIDFILRVIYLLTGQYTHYPHFLPSCLIETIVVGTQK